MLPLTVACPGARATDQLDTHLPLQKFLRLGRSPATLTTRLPPCVKTPAAQFSGKKRPVMYSSSLACRARRSSSLEVSWLLSVVVSSVAFWRKFRHIRTSRMNSSCFNALTHQSQMIQSEYIATLGVKVVCGVDLSRRIDHNLQRQ